MKRLLSLAFVPVIGIGCAAESVVPQQPTAKPVASTDTPAAPSSSAPKNSVMRAKTAMTMDGDLDKQAVIDAVNRKSQALGSCVAVIRTTDSVVGSLNVQVTSDGQQTKFELQSDVSDAAKKCVLSALEGVSVKGKGRAMVLLTLE